MYIYFVFDDVFLGYSGHMFTGDGIGNLARFPLSLPVSVKIWTVQAGQ